MANREERIRVMITKSFGWYTEGEIHEVGNYVTFGYSSGGAHYEKQCGQYGIKLENCIVLTPLPKYTMEQLEGIVGHKFIINE